MAREIVIHKIEIWNVKGRKKLIGALWVGKLFIEWTPARGRPGKMTWDELTECMKRRAV
jgi:hypothetical protein